MYHPPLLLFSGLGWQEILLILLIVLLLFGAKKVPEIMRMFGRGVKEFKKGIKEVGHELEESGPGEEKEPTRKVEGQDTAEGERPPDGEGA